MRIAKKAEIRSNAYWCGWNAGRYGPAEHYFAENPRLAEWEAASSRPDYYRAHRAGREARRRSGDFLAAS